MQYSPGQIIRIKEYQFENNTTRDKYAVILHVNDGKAYVIHSLTTSKNNLGVSNLNHGCNSHQSYIHYYFFPAGEKLTDADFFFDDDTFIFFLNNVREISLEKLNKAAKQLWGGLLTWESFHQMN